MSLSQYNQSSQLTTNAKAQGRKLALKVVFNLETGRSDWVPDVVIKSPPIIDEEEDVLRFD